MSEPHHPPDSERPLTGIEPRMEPPAELENRVVERLRGRGLLANRKAGARTRGLAWAASILIAFTLGLVLSRGGGSPQGNYLLLLDRGPGAALSNAEVEQRIAEYGAWAGQLRDEGVLVAAERLLPGGELLGEGNPGPEASGFFLLSVEGEAHARRLAGACPHLLHGGALRVYAIDAR